MAFQCLNVGKVVCLRHRLQHAKLACAVRLISSARECSISGAVMFFSAYASFRWARKKKYLRRLTALIIVTSFLSAFSGPFSFPFYSNWQLHRLRLSEPYEFSQKYLWFGEIRFFANSIFELVPQGPVEHDIGGGEGWVRVTHYRMFLLKTDIGSIPVGLEFGLLFLLFVMINIMGALLGLLIGKVRTIRQPEGVSTGFWLCVALGIAVLGTGMWLSSGTVISTGPASAYYVSTDPFVYIYDSFVFISFGIAWLLVISLDRIRSQRRTQNQSLSSTPQT